MRNKMSEQVKATVDPLATLPGIGPDVRQVMMEMGIESVDDVRQCSTEELRQVPGIGRQKSLFLKEYLEE